MLKSQELVRKLSELAIGYLTIRDFEEWFVRSSWNASVWATPELRDAVYSVELVLAEYSNRHVDASYLRTFSGDIARELEHSTQSIVPGRIGQNLTSAEIMLAGVAARPVAAAA